MATLPKPFLTPDEYLALERASEEKHEYIDGQMYAMSRASARHSTVTINILAALREQLRGAGCTLFNNDVRVNIPNGRLYTYPDLSVACRPQFLDDQADTLLNPTLIVEVLSTSTQSYDRG